MNPDMKAYKTIYKGGINEIVVKKSKFIATVRPADTEEAAVNYIEQIKKKHWNASHNCYAYIIGTGVPIMRFSDDGEPSQTAGKPMLDVLINHKLAYLVVIVTRYFGGTLLGTGGLVKAYQSAVIEGLNNSHIITKEPGILLRINTDYNYIGILQHYYNRETLPVLSTQYTDIVSFELVIPLTKIGNFKNALIELTHGSAVIEEKEQVYFAVIENEIHLFD